MSAVLAGQGGKARLPHSRAGGQDYRTVGQEGRTSSIVQGRTSSIVQGWTSSTVQGLARPTVQGFTYTAVLDPCTVHRSPHVRVGVHTVHGLLVHVPQCQSGLFGPEPD